MLSRARARQARALPAAPATLDPPPLPRGYIDTGDLMPTGATRVDVASRGYMDRLAAAARPEPAAERRPPMPLSKTVYVTLNRPEGWSHEDWRKLVLRVGRCFEADWIVQRAETAVDAVQPMVVWVLMLPVDLVVEVQGRLFNALDVRPKAARAIWAEATPRTIGGQP